MSTEEIQNEAIEQSIWLVVNAPKNEVWWFDTRSQAREYVYEQRDENGNNTTSKPVKWVLCDVQ